MKVSVIDELAFLRGHGASIAEKLVRNLGEGDFEAELITMSNNQNFIISILKHTPTIRELLFIPAIGGRLIRRCEVSSDLIHTSNTATTAMSSSKKPTMVTIHCCLSRQIDLLRNALPKSYHLAFNSTTYGLYSNLERKGLQNVDLIMAPRRDVADFISNKLKISSKKIRLVYLGIETSRFNLLKKKKEFDVLFVGRGTIAKGFDILLEALPDIEGKVGVVTTHISDSYKDEVLKADNLAVVGEVPHSSMQELYNSARIFMMPSLSEVCPQVTLEAMSCGLPVVCTVQGGGDFVRNGVEGMIIPDRDPKRFAQSINDLLADDNRRESMGEKARMRVCTDFTWEKTLNEIIQIYEELT